jgi:SAM-dependent methyltransferase
MNAGADRQDADLVARQQAHFDSVAADYVKGREERNHIVVKELIWREGLKGVSVKLPARFKVIEPMCGVCEGRDLVRAGLGGDFDYAGFDYSGEIVAAAKARGDGVNVWQADATTVDLPAASYDVAVILGGLHHVPFAADEVMKRVGAALKPGGYFINFEPTDGNSLFRLARRIIYRRNRIFDAETERAFSLPELKAMMRGAGLEPVRLIHAGLAAYTLYYNPYAFPLLNIGSEKTVRAVFAVDRLFMTNPIGGFFSFATFSVWRKI